MIVKDAYPFLALLLALSVAAFWLGMTIVGICASLLAVFVAAFFRNPHREIPVDPGIIVSPADGKIVKIERVGKTTRVSIFLSLFDVHVNRSPIGGTIESVDYRPGKFLAAYKPSASVENERNVVMVSDGRVNIVFTQIAGVVARRIVFWKKVGDRVEKGELVGLIRFGSRVDVLFPAGAKITVELGDRVQGGASPIGEILESSRD